MGASFSKAAEVPTPEALIARAIDLIPILRDRSAHCEQLRQIPPETIDDFKAAGFIRAAQPKRFGGYDYGLDVVARVARQIGRGCGSSAWMAGQWPGHNFMSSLHSLEAQEEYWGTSGPDTLSSTASAVAKLNMAPEKGGWRLTETHLRFSSGCDAAEWIHFMCMHGIGLVPKSDFEILDDWKVAGLRGTGSKSVIIKDAFIPPHRFVTFEDLNNGASPGAKLSDNPFVRTRFVLALNQLLLAPMIGMARGVLDLFEQRVTKRVDLHTGKPASESAGAQLRFAESSAEVDAAEMFQDRNLATLEDWGRRGHIADLKERTAMRRDTTYAALLSVRAALRMTTSGDASGMFDSNQIGRLVRDVQMAGLQASLTWDEPAQSYSRVRWGAPGEASYLTG